MDGAGDVNGDGFDDIIVGAPVANPSGLVASGAAYVFLGGPTGITASSPADADFTLESKQTEGHMGHAVAGAGDVNHDGFADVVVGAEFYGKPFVPPIPNQGSGRFGASFVFLGSAAGIVGTDPATAHAQILPWLIVSGEPGRSPSAGRRVDGAGDVNGDGYDDIIIGAAGFDDTGLNWPAPAPTLPRGRSADLPRRPGRHRPADRAQPPHRGRQAAVRHGLVRVRRRRRQHDGFGDVIVGAEFYPNSDPLLLAQEGAAFVFHGSAAGITATSAQAANRAYFGSAVGEHLGWAVSDAGDTNADGFDDC